MTMTLERALEAARTSASLSLEYSECDHGSAKHCAILTSYRAARRFLVSVHGTADADLVARAYWRAVGDVEAGYADDSEALQLFALDAFTAAACDGLHDLGYDVESLHR